MSKITNKKEEQLSVFDYTTLSSDAAKLAKESAIEIKAREKAIWENIIEIGNRLIEVKTALPHGSFNNWCELEFEWGKTTAQRYMKISEELGNKPHGVFLKDSSIKALYQLASGLSNADEETKEEILDEVEKATEEKGKALTEKEINELPQIKELKDKLKAEQEAKKKAEEKQTSLLTELNSISEKYSAKVNENTQLTTTIANQTKQIQQLNSDISAKESSLKSLQKEQDDVVKLQETLNEKIKTESDRIVQETLEKERVILKQKEVELNDQQQLIEQELKEAQQLKDTALSDKKQRENIQEWICDFRQLVDAMEETAATYKVNNKDLQNIPDFSILEEPEYLAIVGEIEDNRRDFFKVLEEYGKQLHYLTNTITQMDLKRSQSTIEVSVIEGE